VLTLPAKAQSTSQIDSMEAQVKALQEQLTHLKSNLAAHDRTLKRAQEQARQAQVQAQAAHDQATATAASVAQTAAAPPPPVVNTPPGPPGQFKAGEITITLGGFAAAEGVYRSRNQAASIDTNFNTGIPLPNSPNYHMPEFRESAQQSRFSLLAQAQPNPATKLTSYLETDFLSAGTSSNSNQSNSYTLRLRQFWGMYENSNWGLHLEGGQGWTLATMYNQGLLPRQEAVPLTIDAQYVVGFNWARQAELRVVKDFDNQKLWAALSVEEPQTLFGSSGGPNCLTGAAATVPGGTLEATQCGGSNVNTIQAYSDNYAPDLIAKVAADPGWGHYELYGLLRFLDSRVSFASTGSGKSYTDTGEGVGGGMILPLVPNKLNFQVSGLIGRGVGRYGSANLPDATFSTTGKLEPLTNYSVMGGFVGHPIPAVDLYAYGGAEGVGQRSFGATGGYGNPNVSLAGCELELGSCNAVTSSVLEGTVGGWWRFFKGSYGTVQAGLQYEYLKRNVFQGVGATRGSSLSPSSDENVFLFSFRYYPFN
jgi:hypothetical protein